MEPTWQPVRVAAAGDAKVEVLDQPLYEVRKKIYPRAVSGWFARWRIALVLATQLAFYGTAWLTWNGRQAVLFDLVARKFYIFSLVLWPQDFIYLTALLVISALSSLLFYWRLLPWIVRMISRVFERVMGVGGAVALSTAANVFVGMVEAPLFVRPYLVQLSRGDGSADLVQIPAGNAPAPHLQALLTDPKILKLFHFGRFDIAVLLNRFGVKTTPVYCTKIASKLVRTYTDRHGLKDLTRELLGIELSKQQQSSDWAAEALSEAQLAYAASDVLHLHALREKLDAMLVREGRLEVAAACFNFLPVRARLDLLGWPEQDIFAHQ